MVALGSMGAIGIGSAATYQQTANFTFNGTGSGAFLIDFLSSTAWGSGFESAVFQLSLNGNLLVNQSFFDLASAQAYFSNDLTNIALGAGPNAIELAFTETMSGGQGFSFDYAIAGAAATPLPSTWGMMLLGLAAFGIMACRRRRKEAALAS
jgi:hypothetical protein